MPDEEADSKPALPAAHQPGVQSAGSQPVLQPGTQPAPQGLDWKGFWDNVKTLIANGKKAGAQLEASTQTPADDVLLGKVGIITAKVATGKIGEIRLPVRGGTQDYLACAPDGFADTMEVNSTAEVIAFVPPNTVYVKPVRV